MSHPFLSVNSDIPLYLYYSSCSLRKHLYHHTLLRIHKRKIYVYLPETKYYYRLPISYFTFLYYKVEYVCTGDTLRRLQLETVKKNDRGKSLEKICERTSLKSFVKVLLSERKKKLCNFSNKVE